MLHFKTILHATDFSPQSQWAFQLACTLARDHGARLVVVHVKPPPDIIGVDYPVASLPDSAEVEEMLWRQLALLQPPAPVVVEHYLREGQPAPEILALAAECHADIVILGSHGRTGLGRLLLGSVAEDVLRKAPCPVLTVKSPVHALEKVPSVSQEGSGLAY